MLPHERLEAYWLAEEYVAFIDHLLPRVQTVSRHDADQLDRSGGSLVFNLVGSEEAPFIPWAGLRPPLKLHVRISRMQLSLRRFAQCE